jgi:LmbE family N-acetylglucosaminyl deacetylase
MKLRKITILIYILLILIVGYIVYYIFTWDYNNIKRNIKNKLKQLDLEYTNNLMIVAHPDDDLIWGGSHLIDDNYLVVCVTCGTNEQRLNEFKTVMRKTGDQLIILDYPDRINNKKNNWNEVYESISGSLKVIIKYKKWNIIVTHNPDGEYGHIQHRLTSRIVTGLAPKSRLVYFGHYYRNGEVPNNLESISPQNYNIKVKELVPIYVSQSIIRPYGHMLNHEVWIPYSEWSDDNE